MRVVSSQFNVSVKVKRITTGQQIKFARTLRNQQSDAELLLWSKFRSLQLDGVKFRRQYPVGNYIVDFVSLSKRLIIEIDGSQHNEESGKHKDERRTSWLQGEGYKVMRFWNNDVLTNIEGVFTIIQEALVKGEVTRILIAGTCYTLVEHLGDLYR